MNGVVEESGLAGHCRHIVSLTAPMAAGRSRLTVHSLCRVMAFLATLARAVGVNLGDVTRSTGAPHDETEGEFQHQQLRRGRDVLSYPAPRPCVASGLLSSAPVGTRQPRRPNVGTLREQQG